MDNQEKQPLVTCIKAHIQQQTTSFHVPGHKNGFLYPKFADSLLAGDLTEISGLDDLHEPTGAILEGEALLAEAYHAGKSYWLVGGSTSGNLAMLAATLKRGDRVLVIRDAHKSILHGIELAGAYPIFLAPQVNHRFQVATGVDLKQLETALKTYPDVKACVFTYPSYYGLTFDIEAAIKLVHKFGMLALVDEAHGAHLIASNHFPKSALLYGADIVVQSAHKTLPALTMGAYLHIHRDRLALKSQVAYYLQMFQTSSPSYLVMASLDVARHYAVTYKEADFSALKRMKELWRNWLERQGIICLQPNDPLKLVIRKKGYSGYELQAVLEAAGYYPELADQHQVLLIFPLIKAGMQVVPDKPLQFPNKRESFAKNEDGLLAPLPITELALTYDDMQKKTTELVDLDTSIGRISAETIAVYPPGIPQVMRGERLTATNIHNLLVSKTRHLHGGKTLSNNQISVFCD